MAQPYPPGLSIDYGSLDAEACHLRTSALALAWGQYNCNLTKLYFDRLNDEPISTAESKVACTQYLSAVYAHLESAQTMHNRVHGEAEPAQAAKQDVVAAAAQELGVSTKKLRKSANFHNNKSRGNVNGTSPNTGKRNAAGPSGNARAAKRTDRGSSRAGNGGGARSQHTAGNSDQARATRLDELERNRPDGDTLRDLASAGGVTRTLNACIQLIQDRKCIFCGSKHTGAVSCNSIPASLKPAVTTVAARRKALSKASNESDNLDAALASCSLQRRWSPGQPTNI